MHTTHILITRRTDAWDTGRNRVADFVTRVHPRLAAIIGVMVSIITPIFEKIRSAIWKVVLSGLRIAQAVLMLFFFLLCVMTTNGQPTSIWL